MSIAAVIDLGTNTFNLLIAEVREDKSFYTLFENRLNVKLGRGGIGKALLTPEAIDRAMLALELHAGSIQKYGAEIVVPVATSAIRDASNGNVLIERVKFKFGWDIKIIDGDREASLIFQGVYRSLPPIDGYYLLLDIGGGSNEFILANHHSIVWKRSFKIGIARVLEHFHPSDPPSQEEITTIESWFSEQLIPLKKQINRYQPEILVGCSGAFDTLMDILEGADPDITFRKSSFFPLNSFGVIHHQLISKNHEERCMIKGVDKNRVEMIVIASIFINFILKNFGIKQLIHTHYSLKEGVMDELSQGKMNYHLAKKTKFKVQNSKFKNNLPHLHFNI